MQNYPAQNAEHEDNNERHAEYAGDQDGAEWVAHISTVSLMRAPLYSSSITRCFL